MATVEVLLAVFNGERFLQEQLDSLALQTVSTVNIVASDDGSSDASMAILRKAQQSWTRGSFKILGGPHNTRKGFAGNFYHLIRQSSDTADCYAFCDQDDIWHPDKLERAVPLCPNESSNCPAAWASRTELIDQYGAPIGLSPIQEREPNFRNAVLQNIASGNTMVMNRAARQLMIETGTHIGPIAHDHWLYIITTGSGGKFHHSSQPSLKYRQHDKNVIGLKTKPFWKKHLWRFNRYRTGLVRERTAQCIAALQDCSSYLTPEAQQVLREYEIFHSSPSALERFAALQRSGIYRNSLVGQAGLCVDCLFKLR